MWSSSIPASSQSFFKSWTRSRSVQLKPGTCTSFERF